MMEKVAAPVLENLSRRELKKNMPVESSGLEREKYTHIEVICRCLATAPQRSV